MLEQATATRTVIALLLDRTGWMSHLKQETIDAVNAFLQTLETEAGDLVEFTMLQYDSLSTDTLCLGAKLADVPRLTPETYEPRAYGTLIDAAIATIQTTEEMVLRRRDRPRVVVVFLAGGEDEYSQHSRDELRDLIERRRAEGWQFMLVGAGGFDPYAAARGFGIHDDAIVSCGHCVGLMLGMIAAAEIACDFADGLSDRVYFTDEQKRFAYDRYAQCNEGLFENEISDEEIERAMRVHTAEEIMGLLKCNAPSWSASTLEWQDFLTRMRAAPEAPGARCGIAEAERELAHRQAWRDYDSEILEPRRRRVCALLKAFVEAAAERSREAVDGGVDDPDFFSRLGLG